MDTNALKRFAQSARNLLIDQVTAKLAVVVDPASSARRENPGAMKKLDAAIAQVGQVQVIEQVAYTWFSHVLGNILFTPQLEFTASQIRAARDLYKELFGLPADGTEARVLGGEWADSIRKLSDELNRVLSESYKYPFVTALEPFRAQINPMLGKPAVWYITEPVKDEDALLNAKEDMPP